jgi:hypothetical protein
LTFKMVNRSREKIKISPLDNKIGFVKN